MKSVYETVYDKFRDGDSLTDKELDIGIGHFRPMGEMLLRSGPAFRLAAQEALRVADRMEDYKTERNRK